MNLAESRVQLNLILVFLLTVSYFNRFARDAPQRDRDPIGEKEEEKIEANAKFPRGGGGRGGHL